jgi:hypothetical protein
LVFKPVQTNYMKEKDKREERPESYPRPTETDKQIQNQPEYIDQEPNSFEKEISDLPNKEEEKLKT